MTFSSGVKYLVILIPNEGHESTNQPKNQLPLINQPYVPQNAIIENGTSIIWLNADVGHRHKISLNDSNSEKIFDSRFFKYNTTSNAIRLNETGTYQYWESGVSKEVPDFVMMGTITVTSQEQHNATTVSQNKDDIVGTLMVPARFLDKYRSEFEDRGFTIDSTYTYKDLRGGQKGTGPEQTLIVWKVHNVPLKKVVRDLEELTPTLPYN
jgi:plastocyanin